MFVVAYRSDRVWSECGEGARRLMSPNNFHIYPVTPTTKDVRGRNMPWVFG
jgi:hypothetical protein